MFHFLSNNLEFLSALQLIGVSIGVGASTIYAILHLKFLKDFKIDIFESRRLKIISNIEWAAIFLLLSVGICIYYISPAIFKDANNLRIPFAILFLIIFWNAILNFYINPKLIGVRVDLKSMRVWKTFWLRQKGFAFGMASLISWYSILIYSFFNTPISDDGVAMISYYIAIVVAGFVISQVGSFLIDRKVKQ